MVATASSSVSLTDISGGLVPELKRYISLHRGRIEAMINGGPESSGEEVALHHARVLDGVIMSLFQAVRVAMQQQGTWVDVALGAVGSWGRQTLSLHSDLDIRLVSPRGASKAGPVAEALLYPLWDAGLSIGHHVIDPKETLQLARQDLPTATSLLDWRLLCGNGAVHDRLLEDAYQGLFSGDGLRQFLTDLEEGARSRHKRFGDSVYLLEPDVKSGAGGMRDLDIAHWAARARWRVKHLHELVALGVLVDREWADIAAAFDFLMRIRNSLHAGIGRRSDRLSFEHQERIASEYGFGKGGLGVERMMSEYYRHARAIERAREMLITRAMPPPARRPRRRPLDNGLTLVGEEISLTDTDSVESNPSLAMTLYYEAVQRNLAVDATARDAVTRAAGTARFGEVLRASRTAAEQFVALVSTARTTRLRKESVLHEMHDVGLLLAMIPEFLPTVGRVHHDIYHVYTVDIHSIMAHDLLRALYRGDLAQEYPLACRIAAASARPVAVYFATLLHDVGKALGGKGHADRGALMSRDILTRLHQPESIIVEVEHLIRKHLRLYHVATRRDIDDPRTLDVFTDEVRGKEGLRELFLLSVADVATTSPDSMTTWKSRMMDELFRKASGYLQSGEEQRSRPRLRSVLEEVAAEATSDDERHWFEEFVEGMPDRYLYANEATAIARHARVVQAATGQICHVEVLGQSEPYVEVCVVTDDSQGVLAKIAAAMSSARVNVVNAQIYSWRGRQGERRAVDYFWLSAGTEASAVERRLPKVRSRLAKLLSGKAGATEMAAALRQDADSVLRRRVPTVTSSITIDPTGSSQGTVIELITQDRDDLLFWIAHTLSEAGVSITLAKLNTEGERVADVFYVIKPNGEKVVAAEELENLESRLRSTLASLEQAS